MKSKKMKNKNLKYKIFLISAYCLSLFASRFSIAQSYTLIEKLPGLNTTSLTLSSYLGWLFPFILTIVAILAVIMIVIGGLELIGGGSEGLKTNGKKKIEGAIYGLLLAVSAYLILNTINPNLVGTSLSINTATTVVHSPGYYFSYQDSSGGSFAIGPYEDIATCDSGYNSAKTAGTAVTFSCYHFQ